MGNDKGQQWKRYTGLFKDAFQIFRENHPVKFASAIAYFSLFALPCIFLIIVTVLGIIFDKQFLYKELGQQLEKVIGDDGAAMLLTITNNYQEQATNNTLSIIFYIVVVLWLSTQLFRLFQNSLNDLWQIKPDFSSTWRKIYFQRIIPFFLVLVTGSLFFISTLAERAINIFKTGDERNLIGSFIIEIITLMTVFSWFSILYRVLPVVKLKWKQTISGAVITTVLFYLGSWLLWHGVVRRDLEELYDIAASIILIGLWIFYTALIFLYSASFIKALADLNKENIEPVDGAFRYEIIKKNSPGTARAKKI
jgi:membrane protein